jgi:hypothetical protein
MTGTLVAASLLWLGVGFTPVAAAAGCSGPNVRDSPLYYAIDLVSTARVPGTRGASGAVSVRFADSPFGVSLASDGQYAQELEIVVTDLPSPRSGHYVAWLTPPTLDPVLLVGEIRADQSLRTRVEWNKFLVVITLEQNLDPEAMTWAGAIVLRGISRSGRMHTMAGHGAFEAEPCAKYGY